MKKRLKTHQFDLAPTHVESSSGTPEAETKKRKLDYQNNSKVSENESKNDSTSNVDEQINNSTTNDEDKNSGMGFFKDPILGELTCQTCQYQCYGSTKMLKHIKTKHLVISNFESSSRNPEEMVNVIGGMSSNDESEDYQNNSKVSENESKNDSTSNFDEQINNSTRNDEDKNSAIKNSETMKEDYQNDSKVLEIVLKNDSTTSNADDENINDSTTDDEVFYDPEPFMGCPCGKKYFSDIPYKKHMATFHPLTNSPKKDTSYTEEQIKTLNVDKDLDISNIYPNIIEDPNNSNGIEQLVSDPMLTGSAITDFLSTKSVEYSVGYESDATTIVPPVELEVEVEENKNDEFVERFKDKFANDEPKHVSFENRVVTIEYDIDSPANVNGENDVNYESLDQPKNNFEKSTTTQTAQKKVFIYDGSEILSQLGINES